MKIFSICDDFFGSFSLHLLVRKWTWTLRMQWWRAFGFMSEVELTPYKLTLCMFEEFHSMSNFNSKVSCDIFKNINDLRLMKFTSIFQKKMSPLCHMPRSMCHLRIPTCQSDARMSKTLSQIHAAASLLAAAPCMMRWEEKVHCSIGNGRMSRKPLLFWASVSKITQLKEI